MHRLIVVLGPTASGKSTLGVKLAKKFHGVVISADSRQVYRGLNIGTGKITKQEMAGVPHYLLNVAAPRGQYTVDRYVREVNKVLKKIPETTPVFLVGGSPFYIDALTKPNSYSPVPPNPALRRRLEKYPTSRLISTLRRLNPERLKNIDTANRRRLIRAIEIASNHTPLFEGGRAGGGGCAVPNPKIRYQHPETETPPQYRSPGRYAPPAGHDCRDSPITPPGPVLGPFRRFWT